jgi:hypothetical protein
MAKNPRPGNEMADRPSTNPAKNRLYPGTVKQFSTALEKAYERGRADGARGAGAKTTSVKGRIPVVRGVRPSTISPVTGARAKTTGGGGVGRGGSRVEGRIGGAGGGEGGIMGRKKGVR